MDGPDDRQLFDANSNAGQLEQRTLISCRQVSEIVSLAQDRRLGLLERWRLRVHLRVCEGCRNFQGQMSFLRRAVRKHPVLRDDEEK